VDGTHITSRVTPSTRRMLRKWVKFAVGASGSQPVGTGPSDQDVPPVERHHHGDHVEPVEERKSLYGAIAHVTTIRQRRTWARQCIFGPSDSRLGRGCGRNAPRTGKVTSNMPIMT
jgi:hypothetical protein